MDLLTPASGQTTCPYKGAASYYAVEAGGKQHAGLAWEYVAPLPGAARIARHVCFLDERVDVTLDGERQERPVTRFG